MASVELRCPVGPRRLYAKIILTGEHPDIVDGNLVEMTCTDCKKSLRLQGKLVSRVLHRFNLAGELVESILVE